MFDLHNFRKINISRANRWHNGDMNKWSITDWATAMMGEAGEACNAIKKLRRVQDEIKQVNNPGRFLNQEEAAISIIGEELADTLIYLDLVAARLNINLGYEVTKKFNSVSDKYGFPEYL